MNKLESAVQDIMEYHGEDYENGVDGFMEDLAYGGCQSGLVGELVYYSDTVKFYEEHREDINELLYDVLESCGFTSPYDLFGDKWEKEDPLANNTLNKNLLAWFAFEETADRLFYGR